MTSSCLMTKDKGVRTGEAMPASRWDMLEGPDLILSCSKETLVAVLSLKGPAAGMGSSMWRVGSELTRASGSRGVQCAISHCCSNDILCRGKEIICCIGSLWTT